MKRIHTLSALASIRKKLRASVTPQEIILWARLKREQLGYKFRRQHSIGNYVVDFYCPKKKLVIELDGWQHGEKNQKRYDKERTTFLKNAGCIVLRFWNGEVQRNLEGVIGEIEKHL